jgi:very-short-patch-repair endonuclease
VDAAAWELFARLSLSPSADHRSYIVDFYCHQAALVIEVDGSVHQEQQDYDHQRQRDLQSLGLHVIRFSNTDVNQNLEGVLEEILRSCRLASIEKHNPEE